MGKPAKKAANAAFKAMSAKEYERIREALGVSNYALAPRIGVSLRQCQRYEAGTAEVPAVVAKLLRLMAKRGIALAELE